MVTPRSTPWTRSPSRRVLAAVPQRAVTFLHALHRSAVLRAANLFEILDRRGFGKTVRADLAETLRAAQSAPHAEVERETDDAQALLALYRWFRDWSTTAHTVIARKDWLVMLGLAEKRRQDESGGEG